MCKQSKCAFRKASGYCLVHKCECNVLHPEGRCRDGAARAIPHKERWLWQVKEKYDLRTSLGRFRHHTRNARGALIYSQCTKKTRYENEFRAHEVAIRRMRSGAPALRVYYCTYCEGYHLTSRFCRSPRWSANQADDHNLELSA